MACTLPKVAVSSLMLSIRCRLRCRKKNDKLLNYKWQKNVLHWVCHHLAEQHVMFLLNNAYLFPSEWGSVCERFLKETPPLCGCSTEKQAESCHTQPAWRKTSRTSSGSISGAGTEIRHHADWIFPGDTWLNACSQNDPFYRPIPISYVCRSHSKSNVYVNNMAVSLCTIIQHDITSCQVLANCFT